MGGEKVGGACNTRRDMCGCGERGRSMEVRSARVEHKDLAYQIRIDVDALRMLGTKDLDFSGWIFVKAKWQGGEGEL